VLPVDPVLVHAHAALVHDAFVGLGVVAAGLLVWAEARRRGRADERLLVVLAAALVGGAVGMRLGGLVRSLDDVGAGVGVLDAWRYAAKSVLGGLAGAYAGALVGKRLASYDGRTGALFAPAVALGMALGRWGCFLTEPLGRPSGLPWAVRGYHPSYLYEIAFHAAALVVLVRWRDRLAEPADLLVWYLAAYAVFRFLVELTRANPVLALGMTGSQWFLLVLAPALVWRVRAALRTQTSSGRQAPAGIAA
jgi:prolipoprotein diacylglyceryltransferase